MDKMGGILKFSEVQDIKILDGEDRRDLTSISIGACSFGLPGVCNGCEMPFTATRPR